MSEPLPRAFGAPVLTAQYRCIPEDFFVEELAGFDPSGEGEHLLLTVEKRGMNTAFAAKRIAAWAGIAEMGVGYAGLKDRHAVTRQRFSVHLPRKVAPDLAGLVSDDLKVIEASWHSRKLPRGALAGNRFWLLAGAFSGFLLVAPLLATGLYAVSRELEQGRPANLATALAVWVPRDYRLVTFGVLLAFAGTGWVLTSAALITALAPQPVATPMDFVRHVVLAPGGHVFELWLMLGGLLAAPLFASSVVAMPLLLDRRADVLQAVLTSWQAVLANPAPLALWAALIMGLTLLGMATLLAGLVITVPWLGHASWHAYRALVDASSLAERQPPEGER